MVLFRARRRFLTNHLKTNGFRRLLEARIAPEQGEKGDNREKQGETGSEQEEQARKAIGRMSGAEVSRRQAFNPPQALESVR